MSHRILVACRPAQVELLQQQVICSDPPKHLLAFASSFEANEAIERERQLREQADGCKKADSDSTVTDTQTPLLQTTTCDKSCVR